MGWDDRITQILDDDVILHAVGQGALGIECRTDDKDTLDIISTLDHLETRLRCTAERSFMRTLEGGCSVPLGVSTKISEITNGYELELTGSVTSLDGSVQVKHVEKTRLNGTDRDGLVKDAASLGILVANALKAEGATEILEAIPKTVTK